MEIMTELAHQFGIAITHNLGVWGDVGVWVLTIICIVGWYLNFNRILKYYTQAGPTVIRALGFMFPILGAYLGFFFREGDENKN